MPMRDWRAIAKANGSSLSGKELDGVAQPLEALEEVFRPLTQNLTPDVEPALKMVAEADIE
jgi:hypothetical protein